MVSVCSSDAEWPPYTYYQRSGGVITTKLVGYSVDYLQRVLVRQGLHFHVEMVPWVRCMERVGSGEYDMLLNAGINPEREKKYLVTHPYYTLTMVYFYAQARPKPRVDSWRDLTRMRLCGVHGHNYDSFNLQPEQIDTGANDIGQALNKLKAGRCDVVPERLEVVLGYRAIGQIDLARMNIGYAPIPGLKSVPFSMMVSRRVPYARQLLQVLNDGIDNLNAHEGGCDLAARYQIPVAHACR